MTKDEMKNHYCDNINCNHNDTKGLCCLFNPDICKYRQLQKENAENESEARELNIRIDGLIKENAELKEELKDANKKVVHLACNQNKDLKRKITKAKELLKRCYDNYIYLQPLRGDIEQFLNNEVEK